MTTKQQTRTLLNPLLCLTCMFGSCQSSVVGHANLNRKVDALEMFQMGTYNTHKQRDTQCNDLAVKFWQYQAK